MCLRSVFSSSKFRVQPKFLFNPLTPGVHKMFKRTLNILQHLLQDFYRVCDHFVGTRCYRVKSQNFLYDAIFECFKNFMFSFLFRLC